MNTSDAERIERLIEHLRGDDCPLCNEASEALARLRVDAQRYAWLREHVKPWEGFDSGYPYCEIDIFIRELENGSVEKVSIIGPRDCVGMASLDTAVDIAIDAATAPMRADSGNVAQDGTK